MQKVILTGFVGKNPEEKFTSSGTKVTSFSLAVSIRDGKEEKTVWYNINCWKDTFSAMIFYVKRGVPLTIVGELKFPSVYKKQDGTPGINMTVNCESISFLPGRKEEEKKEEKKPDDSGLNW